MRNTKPLTALFVMVVSCVLCVAQPRVLIVTAHPDDESGCAATVYKITHELGGTADLAVITNGEAGYKYSTLANSIYGTELTNEEVGRKELPHIRKKELMAGGSWIGITNYFFFDQLDTYYTLDADTVLSMVWDVAWVKERLSKIIRDGNYDFVFTMVPTEETHGHHKAAGIIALQTVQALANKNVPVPVVLGMAGGRIDSTKPYTQYRGVAVTARDENAPIFEVDLLKKFGYNNKLDYRIIVNWLIAEHKSQGTMQTYMNIGTKENFIFFAMNGRNRIREAQKLFQALSESTP
ncbi:MAG: PIG-L family deacetylase [Ignavibacteria bacterium]|nr:PIG-L family deacetylase [Ignavibacteria bacterium]